MRFYSFLTLLSYAISLFLYFQSPTSFFSFLLTFYPVYQFILATSKGRIFCTLANFHRCLKLRFFLLQSKQFNYLNNV